jgi:ribosomal protein S17
MRSIFFAVLLLGSSPALAENWTGYLVDANCYASEERNVNPFAPSFDANHDRAYEIRVCRPKIRTRKFAVVNANGQSFQLDSSGNVKAADFVRRTGEKRLLNVTVTGDRHEKTVTVESISLAK